MRFFKHLSRAMSCILVIFGLLLATDLFAVYADVYDPGLLNFYTDIDVFQINGLALYTIFEGWNMFQPFYFFINNIAELYLVLGIGLCILILTAISWKMKNYAEEKEFENVLTGKVLLSEMHISHHLRRKLKKATGAVAKTDTITKATVAKKEATKTTKTTNKLAKKEAKRAAKIAKKELKIKNKLAKLKTKNVEATVDLANKQVTAKITNQSFRDKIKKL